VLYWESDFTTIFSIGLKGKSDISAQTFTVACMWRKHWWYWNALQFPLPGLILSCIAFGGGNTIAKIAFVKAAIHLFSNSRQVQP